MINDVKKVAENVTKLIRNIELILRFLPMIPFLGKNVSFAKANREQRCMATKLARGNFNRQKGKITAHWMSLQCGLTLLVNGGDEPKCLCGGRIEKGDMAISLFAKKTRKKACRHDRGKTATNAVELVASMSFTMANVRAIFPDNRVKYAGTTKSGQRVYIIEVDQKETKKLGKFTQGLETYEIRRKALSSRADSDEYDFDTPKETLRAIKEKKKAAQKKHIRKSVRRAEARRIKEEERRAMEEKRALDAATINEYDIDDPASPLANEDHHENVSIANDC